MASSSRAVPLTLNGRLQTKRQDGIYELWRPETDLLPGIKIGQPDLTGGQLFKDNTKTLTW